MTANQPTIEERFSRLETLFVNVGEKVSQHDGNIDVLVANIQELSENIRNLTEQTTRNINKLAEEAAQGNVVSVVTKFINLFDWCEVTGVS